MDLRKFEIRTTMVSRSHSIFSGTDQQAGDRRVCQAVTIRTQ